MSNPRDPQNRPPIGITPDGDVYDEIEKICIAKDRKKAYVAYKLFLRGLALYRVDKRLNGEDDGDSGDATISASGAEDVVTPRLRRRPKKDAKKQSNG